MSSLAWPCFAWLCLMAKNIAGAMLDGYGHGHGLACIWLPHYTDIGPISDEHG